MGQIVQPGDYYEKYMGLVYYKIIKANGIKKIDNVVEFAPGFRCKIAYALKKLNFDGNIYIIDSNANALEFVYQKYRSILPKAKIILVNKDISESISLLPKKATLFLANHCIDDMIISKYLNGKKLKKAFDNTDESKKILLECWNELREDSDNLLKIREHVYDDLINFFEKIDFDLIVMSQYKSAYYMKQKNYVEELSKVIFDQLKLNINTDLNILKAALNFDFKDFGVALNEGFSLKQNIQFYDNWIAGKYVNNNINKDTTDLK